MKKTKVYVITLILVTLLVGCSNNASTKSSQDIVTDTNSPPKEMDSKNEKSAENKTQNDKNNVLVAYFSRIGNIDAENVVDAVSSASVVTQGNDLLGNTEYMATLIQKAVGGDIHFIETSEKYPSEYDDSDDNVLDIQANKENRENARPELATHIKNLEEYNTIFLGFPNWYGDMPMAVYSFLDEYDLTGKKIYLFNSSGGGGVRNAYSEVSDLEPNAKVEKNIFSVSHSQVSQLTDQDMQVWLSEIGYDN